MHPVVYSIPVLTLFLSYSIGAVLLEDKYFAGRDTTEKVDANGTELAVNGTGLAAPNETESAGAATEKPTRRRACSCGDGKCRCCSGAVMQALNLPVSQRLCVDVLYTPEEFQFDYNVNFNDRVLYQNKLSGKNPRPLCLPLSRYLPVTACLKFSNIYMLGRNLHACLEVQGTFLEAEIFDVSFECFRLGTSGLAFVSPEDGGGLPETIPHTAESGSLDYDDSA